jgi:hypothetical protein
LLAGRAVFLRRGLSAALTYPFDVKALNDAYHVVALFIATFGFVSWVRREWRSFTAIFVAGYVLMLSVVPVQDARYLWPLFPLAGYWLIVGAGLVLSAARRPFASRTVAEGSRAKTTRLHAQAFAAATVTVVMLVALASRTADRPARALEDYAEAQQLFTHLKSQGHVDSLRVVFFSPRALTWSTRIAAMGTFEADPTDVVGELEIKQISHVVTGDMGFLPKRDAALRAAIRAYPARFSLSFSNGSFSVYRFTVRAARGGQASADGRVVGTTRVPASLRTSG